jgi:hypothetical protein
MMDKYRVKGRYDLWRGVWEIVESNVPGLAVEAPTRDQFVADIERACADHAEGRDHDVTVTTGWTRMWTVESRFAKRVIVNGKLQTREQLADLTTRFEAAG